MLDRVVGALNRGVDALTRGKSYARDQWTLLDLFTMQATDARPTNEELWRMCGTAFAATKRIATDLACAPIVIRRRTSTGAAEVDPNSAAARIFRTINPTEGRSAFWYKYHGALQTEGNAYMLLDRGVTGQGAVQSVRMLVPNRVEPQGDGLAPAPFFYRTSAGKRLTLRADEVYHAKLPDIYSDLLGMAPLTVAALSAMLEVNTLQHWGTFYKNGARLGGGVKVKKHYNPQQVKEWEAEWARKFSGIRNAYKWVLFHNESEPVSLDGVVPKDADFVGTFKQSREHQLSIMGVPPALIGVFEYANYANADKQVEIYWDDTLAPLMAQVEQDLTEIVLPMIDPSGALFATYDRDAVVALQKRQAERVTRLSNEVSAGLKTLDVARAELNQPPLVSGGSTVWLPSTLTPVGDARVPSASTRSINATHTKYIDTVERNVQRKGVSRAIATLQRAALREFTRALHDAMRRVLAALRRGTGKAAPMHAGEPDAAIKLPRKVGSIFDDDNERAKMEDIIIAVYNRVAKDVEARVVDDLGVDFTIDDPAIAAFLEDNAAEQARNITRMTKDRLNALIVEGHDQGWTIAELADAIEADFAFSVARARTIARTETVRAFNGTTNEAFKANADIIEGKEWMTAGDERVRDSHAAIDGEVVDADETFSNGCEFPGDPNGDAEETINCRCTMVAKVREGKATHVRINKAAFDALFDGHTNGNGARPAVAAAVRAGGK